MGKRLLTAFNIGLILAIAIVLARAPDGGLLTAIFVAILAVCFGLWLYFRRRDEPGAR